jgi:hypothetical protein
MGARRYNLFRALDRRCAWHVSISMRPPVHSRSRSLARALCIVVWTNPPFSPRRSHTHIKSCTHIAQDAFQLLFLTRLQSLTHAHFASGVSRVLQHNQMRRNRNSGEIPHYLIQLYIKLGLIYLHIFLATGACWREGSERSM